ncbi:hypothetical protein [Sphingopyxis sp. GW247-27LB]|uniref:DUF7831 domain-containing protein n=1 Tax=Sphingopyxis sp. GW247-27LB TaxID=2012632 RepID=UPI000BA767A1|nr:hypothetical protein [Sphingopyxis sp. GW247-27LB]PAL23576.1 hypothetical protein CD928_05780 [Sphingopyxis sp. GW247-27LB]
MVGQVKYLEWVTRDMLRAEPGARFVFGDNCQRVGMGGQAAAMRGEPNAIGIATKFAPGMGDGDFYHEGSIAALQSVTFDLSLVSAALVRGLTVYVPRDGLGTGLSQLPQRAPSLMNLIVAFFRACPGEPCEWEFV